jgi:glycerol-3-phosphate acyltransferase PlsY
MVTTVALVLLAYLAGSIPSGYLLVRATRSLDVRNYGSHSVGAINVVRVGGIWLGLVTLLADVGKAFGIVLVAARIGPSPGAVAAAGLLVMVGHAYAPWFLLRERRFSGGKSVACGLGVLLALAHVGVLPWRLALAPLAVWICGLAAPRLVTGRWCWISPATMLASACVPLAVWAAHPQRDYVVLSVGMAALILVKHKDNIRRLRAGTEPRLGERLREAPPAGPQQTPHGSVAKGKELSINLTLQGGRP